MMEYCRLCAELKDPYEIVVSLDDVEELMEDKLRACCGWTTKNTEQHRLPHSVCAICLVKLDKCWLFSRSVQLAQQRLLEIFENGAETKPLALEIDQTLDDSIEPTKNDLQSTISNTSNFRCHICHKSFKSQRSLHAHCRFQSRNRCKICSHEFCTAAELTMHQQQGCEGMIEIGSMAMDCKPTVVEWNLEHHDEDEKIHSINDDSKANERNSNRSGQSDASEQDEPFDTKPSLEKKSNNNRSKQPKRGQIKCDDNPKAQKCSARTRDPPFECDVCGKRFGNKSHLIPHKQTHARRVKAIKNDAQFECWLCHKILARRNSVKRHIKIHMCELKPIAKRFICELCGKSFRCIAFLTDHLSSHSDQRPHKCDVCGLGYKTKRLLWKHKITHTEFKHKCTECDRVFRKKGSLKVHMETHTGVINKPHICDVCGSGFRRNYELVEHRRIHTGEKPYTCEHCNINFRSMSSCYDHLKKMHGISVSARNREEQARATAMSANVIAADEVKLSN